MKVSSSFSRRKEDRMKCPILLIPLLVSVILITLAVPFAFGQQEYHGADSVFRMEGITILWAILKGPDEDRSWVQLKIVYPEEGNFRYQLFSVEAVDPFTGKKEWVVKGEKLGKENVVKSFRVSFRDMTGRRILFYRDSKELQDNRPPMTIFYMGIPDTSPELLTEKQVEDYFSKALERLKP
jgi:hypothetical protein